MTNKFRDALERIKNHTPKYGAFEDGFQSDADIAALEELVATLQNDAETIKTLDDVGRGYERGNIIGAYVLIEAIKARPLFKKLAKLVKEGE